MPEIADKTPADRGVARVRVEDALADITALIRKNRLVEGLVHEAAGLDLALLGMSFRSRTEMRREGETLTLVKRY